MLNSFGEFAKDARFGLATRESAKAADSTLTGSRLGAKHLFVFRNSRTTLAQAQRDEAPWPSPIMSWSLSTGMNRAVWSPAKARRRRALSPPNARPARSR